MRGAWVGVLVAMGSAASMLACGRVQSGSSPARRDAPSPHLDAGASIELVEASTHPREASARDARTAFDAHAEPSDGALAACKHRAGDLGWSLLDSTPRVTHCVTTVATRYLTGEILRFDTRCAPQAASTESAARASAVGAVGSAGALVPPFDPGFYLFSSLVHDAGASPSLVVVPDEGPVAFAAGFERDGGVVAVPRQWHLPGELFPACDEQALLPILPADPLGVADGDFANRIEAGERAIWATALPDVVRYWGLLPPALAFAFSENPSSRDLDQAEIVFVIRSWWRVLD
jgi:hypothetical protein